MVMTETQVYEEVTRHLAKYHTDLIWHWDLAGVNNPSRASRALYGRLNKRGWPDLVIDEPRMMPGTTNVYYGLRLEVKRPGERIRKRNGDWASEHIAEQAAQILKHRQKGYVADFTIGTEDTLSHIHSYLGDVCNEWLHADGSVF
jgi:hypothetical protein